MVELTGETRYYAVDIGEIGYTVIEQKDTNSNYTEWLVERLDMNEVTNEEKEEVLKLVQEYLNKKEV